jgi:hypothetical protein
MLTADFNPYLVFLLFLSMHNNCSNVRASLCVSISILSLKENIFPKENKTVLHLNDSIPFKLY